VRAGENTLQPFKERPPDRVIVADDIVFLDLGPIFEEWEADFGRTFVLGPDPRRRPSGCACAGLGRGREHFERCPEITGAELFDYTVESAWPRVSGGAAHRRPLVGSFAQDDRG